MAQRSRLIPLACLQRKSNQHPRSLVLIFTWCTVTLGQFSAITQLESLDSYTSQTPSQHLLPLLPSLYTNTIICFMASAKSKIMLSSYTLISLFPLLLNHIDASLFINARKLKMNCSANKILTSLKRWMAPLLGFRLSSLSPNQKIQKR